ncbi:MAG: hypothetical protein NTY80_01555 [candidate division SR1 bacterium]|nr:hypothetical protein [candidate division SR1 bacterium]
MSGTKILVIFLVFLIFLVGVAVIYTTYYDDSKPTKIKQLQQEITVLQEIKDAVTEKYLPGYLNESLVGVSHDLQFTTTGSEDYWQAIKKMNEAEKIIGNCKPCLYIQSLLLAKTMELARLEEK